MQIQSEDKPYDDLNITPMLDLAYVLLVIFILLTTASVQGAKVDLPKASATQNLAQPKTQLISVNPDGQMTLNTTPVSFAELERKLRDAKATNPTLPVIIRGDRAAQYEKIINVLDLCGNLGITSVGLASQHVSRP
jgi:biopolymer transport protein ExbD